MLDLIKKDLNKLKNKQKAIAYKSFFKTSKDDYGVGDVFLGVSSHEIKKIAKKYYQKVKLTDLHKLLQSPIHEFRMTAVQILILKYKNGDKRKKDKIFNFYKKNSTLINNWDLVDVSAHKIIGDYLLKFKNQSNNYKTLSYLAQSKNLWQRRISIIATYAFIKDGKLSPTIKICRILLKDEHDLIHKACGWMLRELGKKDKNLLEKFLKTNIKQMSRTTLRYAIEKLPQGKQKYFLNLEYK